MSLALKVGTVHEKCITDHLRHYSSEFKMISLGDPNIIKYVLMIKGVPPYMLMVSKKKENVYTPDGKSHNIMVTVMGKDDKITHQILKDFEKRIPFKLREPSELTRKQAQPFFELIKTVFNNT